MATSRPPSKQIQQRVAAAFGISRAELVGGSRAATPLRARQVAILLTREATELSLPQIGRLYGGRDHSTVLNSLRRVETALADDTDLARQVGELRSAIHSPADRERPDRRPHCKNQCLPQARPQAPIRLATPNLGAFRVFHKD